MKWILRIPLYPVIWNVYRKSFLTYTFLLGMTRYVIWYPVQKEIAKMMNVLGTLFLPILVLEKVHRRIVALEDRLRKVMMIVDLDFLGVSTESHALLPFVKRYREQE